MQPLVQRVQPVGGPGCRFHRHTPVVPVPRVASPGVPLLRCRPSAHGLRVLRRRVTAVRCACVWRAARGSRSARAGPGATTDASSDSGPSPSARTRSRRRRRRRRRVSLSSVRGGRLALRSLSHRAAAGRRASHQVGQVKSGRAASAPAAGPAVLEGAVASATSGQWLTPRRASVERRREGRERPRGRPSPRLLSISPRGPATLRRYLSWSNGVQSPASGPALSDGTW